jgi:NDP-sugar pyrophosphorylase family protein
MKAILLAAGKGERLKPLTEYTPKVMVRVNGKPILEHHVEKLAAIGIQDVFINLHYLPDKIQDHFKTGAQWGLNIRYSLETEILGTAGAVKKLEKDLKPGPFLVIYGDNFLDIDYKDFLSYSRKKGGMGTVAAFEKDDVRGGGILDFDSDLKVKRFKEKPHPKEIFSHWVSAGVFCFNEKIFGYIQPGFSDFGYDVLPKALANDERLFVYKLKGKVWGIDSPELLRELMTLNKRRQNT